MKGPAYCCTTFSLATPSKLPTDIFIPLIPSSNALRRTLGSFCGMSLTRLTSPAKPSCCALVRGLGKLTYCVRLIASPCAMIIGSGNAQEPDAHLA